MQKVISGILESRWFWFLARLCLVVMFLASGLAKLIDFDGGMAEMQAAGLAPAALFNVLVIITLLAGAVLILIDRAVWLAAGMLGGFLFLTILIVHTFWNKTGAEAQISMFFALEHIVVIGGLMAAAITSHLRRKIAGLSA
ncbi:DoxX family protein [Thalassospira sp. SM2505]|mgnify:CR=1 FL=1|uniref:DoxX family protein n=1 Tax=Thalassospira profundimaris TaxID=502049 RepID=A0A367WPX4_9PROT|nr:DoxX family protein [Thalassospira profundimaris]RCK43503.1 DoxX family protein [Thalassospira profundimaris]